MPVTATRQHHARAGFVPRQTIGTALLVVVAAFAVARGQSTTPADSGADSYDGRVVRELHIAGLDRIDEGYVRNQIRTRAGQPYDSKQMTADIGRLLRTGRFLDAQARLEPADNEVIVALELREKPVVRSIEITGNRVFSTKDLTKDLDFVVGDAIDRFLVNQGRDTIERKYRDKGYAYAEVKLDDDALQREQRVVYTITEGPRVRIRKFTYEGATAFGKRRLDRLVSSKPYMLIFRTGEYDPEKVQRDAENIQTFYREQGFLDAEVSYRPEFLDAARENLRIVFVINEGVRYTVRDIRFTGNTVLSRDELLNVLRLKPGEFFDAFKLKSDVQTVQDGYGSRGYIYAVITPERVFAEEPEQVILTLHIDEGRQYYIGRIEINGNQITQDRVARRELRFYPEDVYDTTKTRDAEERLRNTQLFTDAKITPVGNAENVRDALVEVEENARTNNFIFGLGVSSDAGTVGNIVLENSNFDIADWPRSWGEFFRGRSFRGAGQTARIQLEPGTEVSRFRIDFREPYLFDQPIGFNTSAFYMERDRGPYSEERLGLTWSLDHRFESGALKDWTARLGFRTEWVDINDVRSFSAKDIRDVEGTSLLTSVEPTLIHNTTDHVFNPTRGHKFRLSWEQAGALGGDYAYAKLEASYVQHWTITTDAYNRKTVLSVRGNAGYIVGDAPVFERYYAGGIGSMRGFSFRGISPEDGLRNDKIGGDFMVLTGAEYTIPLYEDLMHGVFFLDMGTVERDLEITSWRSAVGFGLRITLPIFGRIPMEFDLAAPLTKEDEDDTRIFSFYIGFPFF